MVQLVEFSEARKMCVVAYYLFERIGGTEVAAEGQWLSR